jgi:hypothetical protein
LAKPKPQRYCGASGLGLSLDREREASPVDRFGVAAAATPVSIASIAATLSGVSEKSKTSQIGQRLDQGALGIEHIAELV